MRDAGLAHHAGGRWGQRRGRPGGDDRMNENDPARYAELRPGIVAALSTVYDPEIPVNIYELGLIYDIVVDAASAVAIRMTLTAPACPAAQFLPEEVKTKVSAVPNVTDVTVEVV